MPINKQTIEQIISNLSQRMPAFLNEAHLQYEFAIELKNMFPEANCILEYRPIVSCYKQGFNKKNYHKIDLKVEDKGKVYYFEFKYIPNDITVSINGLFFQLKNQEGFTDRRKEIWKDIEKLENINSTKSYFIMITNNNGILNGVHNNKYTVCDDSRLKPLTNYTKAYNFSVSIQNQYLFEYKDYFIQYGLKYLILEI